jgi:hypothetical protein
MKNMITFAASEAAAYPSSVVGARSASARVAVRSWRRCTGTTGGAGSTGITGTGIAVTTRTSVAPNLATGLRHTFVDPHHGSRSRTRCRLS